MPFKSAKQRAYLFSQRPDVAKKFAADAGDMLAPIEKPKKKKIKDFLSPSK